MRVRDLSGEQRNTLATAMVYTDDIAQIRALLKRAEKRQIDATRMIEKLIERNNIENILLVAREESISEKDKLKLAEAIIKSKSLKYMYRFVKEVDDIPNVAMDAFADVIVATNISEYIFLFAKYLKKFQ